MKTLARTLALTITLLAIVPCVSASAGQAESVPPKSGLVPVSVRSDATFTERDLAALLPKLAKRLDTGSNATLSVTKPTAAVTRMRALLALVKVAVSEEEIASYRSEMPEDMPADTAQVPLWGQPYLAAAVVRGWWKADRVFGPKQPATWKFVESILAPMCYRPEHTEQVVRGTSVSEVKSERAAYTGLILDASDLKVERSMSPRILDEEGQVVYPDPKHLPDIDYVQDHGMMNYDSSVETAKRAGSSPLIVKALKTAGYAGSDIVVSNEAAAQIREANSTSKFLWKWAVSVLSGNGKPKPLIAEHKSAE